MLIALSEAETILLFIGSTTPLLFSIFWAVRRFVLLEDRVKELEKRLNERNSSEE